jgi:hypothetical protein
VLAIWRASVPEEVRKKWLNIDPTEEDRVELSEQAKSEPEKTAEAAPVEEAK